MIITPPFTEEQKKLIEMTDKLAEKKGRCSDLSDVDDEVTYYGSVLEETIRKVETQDMTNDEWRRTCSTEEFADFIRQLLYESYKPEERVVRKKIGDYFANKYDGDVERTWKEAVKEWLKEKHDEMSML